MIEIIVLASGSAGNAALVRTESAAFLVDAGLSARELTARLALCGTEPRDLSGILITHEHGDHVKGLPQWTKKHSTPVYCNRRTAMILRERMEDFGGWNLFESGAEFELHGVAVRTFSIPHDAVDPVGFTVSRRGRSFGFATDLGHATTLVAESLRGVDGLLLEANYDEALLEKDTKRPWSTKQRIQSRHGHLSNGASAGLVSLIRHEGLGHLLLGHLSRDCNSEELALSAISPVVEGASVSLSCASQEEMSPPIRLD